MRKDGFERFYLTKVALGEGCGCAERVIDVHEFDRLAGRSRLRLRPLSLSGVKRALKKFGLYRRR